MKRNLRQKKRCDDCKLSPGFALFNVKKPPDYQNLSSEIKVSMDFKSEDSCLSLEPQVDMLHSLPQNNLDTYSILLSDLCSSNKTLDDNSLNTDMHEKNEPNVSQQGQNGEITELSLSDVELIVQEWRKRQGV